MAFHGNFPKDEKAKLTKYWRESKHDRDKFAELVKSDKDMIKKRTWDTWRMAATRYIESYRKSKPSKSKYPFINLPDQGVELAALIADDNVTWEQILSNPKYSQIKRSDMYYFARSKGIKVNKKEATKMAKQEAEKLTPEQVEQKLIEQRKNGEISVEDFLAKLPENNQIRKKWDCIKKLLVEKRIITNSVDVLPYAKELGCSSKKRVTKLTHTRGVLSNFHQWGLLAQVNTGKQFAYLCNLPDFYSPDELHMLVPDHVVNLLFSDLNSGEKVPFSVIANSMKEVLGSNLVRTLLNYFVKINALVKPSKSDSYQLTGATKIMGGTSKDDLFALNLFEADNVLDAKETADAAKAINSLDDFYKMVKEDRESKRVKEVEVSTGDRNSIRIVMAGEQRIGNQFSDENLIKYGIELVKKVNPDLTIVSGLVQGDHKSFQVDRLKALVKGPLSRVSAQIKTAGLLLDDLAKASKIGVWDILSDDDWNIGKSRAIIAMKELLGLRRFGFSALLPTEISRLSGRDYVRFTEIQWEYIAPYMHRLGRSLLNAEEVSAIDPNLRKDELLLIMIVLLYKKFGHEIKDSIKKIVDLEALVGDKKDSKRFVTPDPLLLKWVGGNKVIQFIHNSGYSDVTQNLDSLIILEKSFRQLQARGVKTPNFVFDFNQERFFGTNVGGSFLFNLAGCQNTVVAAARQHKTFNTQIVGEKSHKQNAFRKEPVSSAIHDFEIFEDGRFKFRLMNNAVMQVLENNRSNPEVKERLALFQDIQTGSPQMRLEWAIKAHDLALYGPNPVQHVSYNGDLLHGFSIYMQFVSESRIKKLVSIKSQQAMFEKCFLPFYPAPTVTHIGRVLGNHEWDNLMAKKEGGDPLSFLEANLNKSYEKLREGYKLGQLDMGRKESEIVYPYPDAEIIAYSRGRTSNSGNPEDGGTAHWPIYTKPIGGGFRYAVQHKWQPFGGGGRTPVDSQLRWVTNMAKAAEGIHVMLGGHYHSFWVAQLADKLLLQMPGLIDQSGLELGFGLTPLSLFCMVEFSNKEGITVEMYPMEYLIDYKCRSPFYKDKNDLLVRPKPGSREYDYGFDSPLIKQWEDEVDSKHMDILPKP